MICLRTRRILTVLSLILFSSLILALLPTNVSAATSTSAISLQNYNTVIVVDSQQYYGTYENIGKYKYTGSPIKPTIKIYPLKSMIISGGALTQGTDYSISYPSDITTPNIKYVEIKGKGKYTGSVTLYYSITLTGPTTTPKPTTTTPKPTSYSITLKSSVNGSASLSKTKAKANEYISVNAYPNAGYEFDRIVVGGTTYYNEFFYMPAKAVTVTVYFKALPKYAITVTTDGNGTAKASKTKGYSGESITITSTPNDYYEFDYILVNGTRINGNKFSMPGKATTVKVVFKEIVMTHKLTKVSAKDPTCTKEGNLEYYVCEDKDCGCRKAYKDMYGRNEIDNIENTILPATGHSIECVDEHTATCTETGNIKHWKCSKCGQLFKDADGKYETNANAIVISKEKHTLTTVAEIAPTKITSGQCLHYKCEKCGTLFADAKGTREVTESELVIPKLTHYLTAIPSVEPTCTKTGNLAYYVCEDKECNCGKLYKDNYGQNIIDDISYTIVPALGHKAVKTNAKSATCTDNGNIDYWKCSRCGHLFKNSKCTEEISTSDTVIKAYGHDLKHHAAKAETYEEDGHDEYYECLRCGKLFADSEGKKTTTKASITRPQKGAPDLGDAVEYGNSMFVVTNPSTDGTGTFTFTGLIEKEETVVVPETIIIKGNSYKINRIGPKAFYGDTTIKSLVIGKNVEVIDANAFYGCSSLLKVSGGSNLKTIGVNAFACCPKLSSFVITSKVLAKIGSNTFYKDSKLKTIYLNNTIKLSKAGVKNSLKGSSVKTVKVKKAKVKAYKKIFKKSNSGRSVKVK